MDQEFPSAREVYEAVGLCLHRWSDVEWALSFLWSALHGFGELDREPIIVVFTAVHSLEVRLAMLNAYIQESDETRLSAKFRASWNAAFNKAAKLYSKRHQIAHFNILYRGDTARLTPFFTVSDMAGDKYPAPPLTADEIRERAASFERFSGRVGRLAIWVRAHEDRVTAAQLRGADLDRLLDNPFDPNSLGIERSHLPFLW